MVAKRETYPRVYQTYIQLCHSSLDNSFRSLGCERSGTVEFTGGEYFEGDTWASIAAAALADMETWLAGLTVSEWTIICLGTEEDPDRRVNGCRVWRLPKNRQVMEEDSREVLVPLDQGRLLDYFRSLA